MFETSYFVSMSLDYTKTTELILFKIMYFLSLSRGQNIP